MTPRVSLEGVTSAGAYYRVARHFPIDRRRRLVALIENVASPDGSVQQRFDGFVRSVRMFANQAAAEFGSERRRVRPLSGASKFLWYRFPLHGFIYDSQVLAAICKNGLTVRFDTLIDAFGGRPSDPHEWNFLIAAAAYRAFVLPLHRPVAEIFAATVSSRNGRPGCSTRCSGSKAMSDRRQAAPFKRPISCWQKPSAKKPSYGATRLSLA
jgi:hypothetical protein